MLKFYFNKKILVGFLLALTILSWLGFSSYQNTKKLLSSGQQVAHTIDVLYNTERLFAIITNIELGQRGFSITGNEVFLQPYKKANNEIMAHLQSLKELTRDSPAQQSRLHNLDLTLQSLLRFSANAVDKRRQSFEASRDLNMTMEGKHLMDRVRQIIADIKEEESALLNERNQVLSSQMENFNVTFTALLIATVMILVAIFYAINLNMKSRTATEERLKFALTEITDLYDNAPCGYHSLDERGVFVKVNQTFASWLGYTKEEMLGKMKFTEIISEHDLPYFYKNFDAFKVSGFIYNAEFECIRKDGSSLPVVLSSVAITDSNGHYLKSRSTTFDNTDRKIAENQIKNLNQELEAFTYSVSHDLRAPLRSVDGYSRILQEDYAPKLDPEGLRVVQVIINNAKRMGKLIDDLLDFARLGRKEAFRANVDMAGLVKGLTNDLIEQEKGREVEIEIGSLATAYADADMMRQVWENLLSNALKYTSKAPKARIVVNSSVNEKEVCYFVQDNGVGFDMQYSSKLFGVFQRLHKMQDFSGTGVGLAIVKRIIDRHEGRVWAEGKLNKGATFYFSIPNQNGKQQHS
jgi:PAS domain S-box-containing protein